MESFRNIDDVRSAVRKGVRLKYVFFWGHTSAHSGLVGKECFSQWYPSAFHADGRRFATAEHYMMFSKATLFDDRESADRILASPSPGAAKALGRAVRGFDDGVWEKHRFDIAVAGNVAKFSQDAALQAFLLGTKDRVLVEASPVDRIWGIGLAQDDQHIENPMMWRGLNLLGFALMRAREQIAPQGAS